MSFFDRDAGSQVSFSSSQRKTNSLIGIDITLHTFFHALSKKRVFENNASHCLVMCFGHQFEGFADTFCFAATSTSQEIKFSNFLWPVLD